MRVAVTGATGFVGKALVTTLAARGHHVRAASRREVAVPDGVEQIRHGDLAGDVDWAPVVRGVDAVVHLAGIAHTQGVADDRYDRVNHLQTAALSAAARSAGAKHLVLVSSIRAQTGATADHALTEADPPLPSDAYGRSKLAAERAVVASGIPFTILRPVLVYGPGVKGNLAALAKLARLPVPLPFGAMTARRSLCALDGLVDAIALVLEREAARSQIYVVADRGPIALRDLIVALRRAAGRRPALVPVPPVLMRTALRMLGRGSLWDRLGGELVVDPARLIALGWQAPVTSTGLAAMVKGPR